MSNPVTHYRRVAQTACGAFVATAAATVMLAVMVTAHAETGVPSSLEAPQAQPVATMSASGVQVYSCEYGDGHRLGWVLKGPSATLYDAAGHASIQHFAGPSWQAEDGSRIVGHVLAQAPSDTPQSIPQLLLRADNMAGDGMLSRVRYVQRVDTIGGVMPAQACTAEHQTGSSPYLAHYVFLK